MTGARSGRFEPICAILSVMQPRRRQVRVRPPVPGRPAPPRRTRRNPSSPSGVFEIPPALFHEALPYNDAPLTHGSPEQATLDLLEFEIGESSAAWPADLAFMGVERVARTLSRVHVFPSGAWFVWLPSVGTSEGAWYHGRRLLETLRPARSRPPELRSGPQGGLYIGYPGRLAIDIDSHRVLGALPGAIVRVPTRRGAKAEARPRANPVARPAPPRPLRPPRPRRPRSRPRTR
jgi:hypothetical protein